MIINKQLAKQLEALVHPDIEKAIKLLLEYVILEKEALFDNPTATDSELRQFQGQKILVKELKEYRKRIQDAILRESESKIDAER